MGGGVNLLQLLDADLGINLRRRELGVPELLLDEPHVGPVLQHERRHRVPEQVAGPALAGLGPVNGVAQELRQPARLERAAQVRQEHRAVIRRRRERRPRFLDVAAHPRERAFAHRDHPVLFAFALADHHGAALLVEVVGHVGKQLRVRRGDGRELPGNYWTFSHGYAVTSHAAQGKTVDEVLVVASRTRTRAGPRSSWKGCARRNA